MRKENVYPKVFPLNETQKRAIEKEISGMSSEELAGQMLMQGFNADFSNTNSAAFKRLKTLITKYHTGGFVVFTGSLHNYSWVTESLQSISRLPLLFGADFERGLAMRIPDMLQYPHNMALGVAGDGNLVSEFAKTVALEARAIGIHQNYAPVLDLQEVGDNPIVNIRAFSRDAKIVSKLGKAFVDGCKKARSLSTAKHFPGHGSTDIDSHQDVPVISKPYKKLLEEDILPFRTAIEAGVHSVMVGHLIVPALDDSMMPAVISRKIINDFLIIELGFDGLVVTDAMNMQGVCNYYSVREATVLSIEAGSDLLLVNADDEIAYEAVTEAVNTGRIKRERLESSVRKILSAKHWLGLFANRYNEPGKVQGLVNTTHSEFLSSKIAKKSLRLFTKGKKKFSVIGEIGCIGISDKIESAQELRFHLLMNEHFTAKLNFIVNNKWRTEEFGDITAGLKKCDTIIVPVFIRIRAYQGKVKLTELQEQLIKWIADSGKNYIIISFGDPYYIQKFGEINNIIFAYSDSFTSQEAVMDFLLGKFKLTPN